MTGKSLGMVLAEAMNYEWAAGVGDRYAAKWELAALAIRREIAGWLVCGRCAGLGTISERRGTMFETDSAEERAACWYQVKCPACDGLGRVEPNAKT